LLDADYRLTYLLTYRPCVTMATVEGSVMVIVVVLSRRFHVNPDNVTTPIAASLGDLTTISLLAAFARGLYWLVDVSDCSNDSSCSEWFCSMSYMCVCLVISPFFKFLSIDNMTALLPDITRTSKAYDTSEIFSGRSLTAVQAWQTCPLWEPSPSHHILG